MDGAAGKVPAAAATANPSTSKDSSKTSQKDSMLGSGATAKFKKKLEKYDISKDEFALAPVSWSPSRPKPHFIPGIWHDDEIEDLSRYIDWHREHPGCATPRPLRGDDDPSALGGKKLDEGNPKLFYTSNGLKPTPLPPDFYPSYLGVDCDVDEVTSVALSQEYQEKLSVNHDEDPWYMMSVKDQLEQSHYDGDNTTLTSKTRRTVQTKMSAFSKEAAWQQDQYGEYLGGAPATNHHYLKQCADVALKDKAILHPHLASEKVGPWHNAHKFSRYTEKGTALDEFNEEALMRTVNSALQVHKKEVYRESVQMGTISRKSRKKGRASDKFGFFGRGGKTDKSRRGGGGEAGGSAKVAPAPIDQYSIMRDKIGDEKEIEKMSFTLIKLAKHVAKKAKIQKSAVDTQIDLVEACKKLRVVKVRALLLSKEVDPNMLTPEDEPIFLHMFERAVKMDMNSGLVRLRHAHQDSGDRKKISRILSSLAGRNDLQINTLDGKDGYAPVHLAAIGDNSKLISWLFKHGGDLNLMSRRDDMTPLMLAAKFGHVELMGEMLRKHIPLDIANKTEGMTALHVAGMYGQTRAAMFLLRVGAMKLKQDKHGRTAAEIASESKFLATSQAIASYAAEPPTVAAQLQFFVDTEVAASLKRSQRQLHARKTAMENFADLVDLANISAGATALATVVATQARKIASATYKGARKLLFPNTVFVEEDEDDDGGYDSEEEEELEKEIELKEESKKETRRLIAYNDPFSSSKKKPYSGVLVSDKIIHQQMAEQRAKEESRSAKKAKLEAEIAEMRAEREKYRRPSSRSGLNSADGGKGSRVSTAANAISLEDAGLLGVSDKEQGLVIASDDTVETALLNPARRDVDNSADQVMAGAGTVGRGGAGRSRSGGAAPLTVAPTDAVMYTDRSTDSAAASRRGIGGQEEKKRKTKNNPKKAATIDGISRISEERYGFDSEQAEQERDEQGTLVPHLSLSSGGGVIAFHEEFPQSPVGSSVI